MNRSRRIRVLVATSVAAGVGATLTAIAAVGQGSPPASPAAAAPGASQVKQSATRLAQDPQALHFGLDAASAREIPAPNGDAVSWTVVPGATGRCVSLPGVAFCGANAEFEARGLYVVSPPPPVASRMADGAIVLATGAGTDVIEGIAPPGFAKVTAVSADGSQLAETSIQDQLFELQVPTDGSRYELSLIRKNGTAVRMAG